MDRANLLFLAPETIYRYCYGVLQFFIPVVNLKTNAKVSYSKTSVNWGRILVPSEREGPRVES